ncbi:uncharacterized protein DDB_G0286299-like isoform X2 [Ornithodoros turicata]|uniref:uncharacterized protein DDB_G0286299-like isoform X2 n=1 Tax=Ornithodoros turicata TaxID=34597 RepID=UPI0031399187
MRPRQLFTFLFPLQRHGRMVNTDKKMNEHTSLYEYWRSLLMEEQHNEERNNRLMRKLDEIEQRTSMLNERSERLKQLRENLSDLIRQRYLSEDEVGPGGNFFSKSQDYSPPEYIPDPILLGLSTPPWVGYDPTKPLLPPKQDSIPKWTSPTPPPTVPTAPPMGSSPDSPPRPTSNDKVVPTLREEEKSAAKQKVTWMNQFPGAGADFSLFEPSISWLPDGGEFYRTTSALESRQAMARPMYCREETKSVVPPPPPSVMSQYSYYVPNNMALAAQTQEVVSTSTTIPDLNTMQITHTTDVLLSDDTRQDVGQDASEKLKGGKTKPQDTTRKEPKKVAGGTKQIAGGRGKSNQQSWSESSKEAKKTESREPPVRPPRNPHRRRAPTEPLRQEAKKADPRDTKPKASIKVGTGQQDSSKKETSEEDSSERSKTTFKESSYRQELYEQKQQLDKEERETEKSEADNAVPKAVTWRNDETPREPQGPDVPRKDTSGSTKKDGDRERGDKTMDADSSRFQKDTVHSERSQDSGDKHGDQTSRSSKPREIGRTPTKKQRSCTSSSSSSSTSSSSSSSSSSKDSIRREAAALSDTKANLSEDNSEDSFFDKEVAIKDTPAYHMLLGQTPVATKEQTPASEHPSESSNEIENELVVAVMSTQSSKQKAKDPDKTSDHGSNASTPPEYDVASVNVHNIISARVRQKVPSLLSRKGLDMYSAPALPRKKSDDDDSFFD